MSDITMCKDDDCPAAKQCWRYNAPETLAWQSYFIESPREGDSCAYFWLRDVK
jgi:hypothetical protein